MKDNVLDNALLYMCDNSSITLIDIIKCANCSSNDAFLVMNYLVKKNVIADQGEGVFAVVANKSQLAKMSKGDKVVEHAEQQSQTPVHAGIGSKVVEQILQQTQPTAPASIDSDDEGWMSNINKQINITKSNNNDSNTHDEGIGVCLKGQNATTLQGNTLPSDTPLIMLIKFTKQLGGDKVAKLFKHKIEYLNILTTNGRCKEGGLIMFCYVGHSVVRLEWDEPMNTQCPPIASAKDGLVLELRYI